MNQLNIWGLILVIFFVASCRSDKPNSSGSDVTTEMPKSVTVPSFDRDSALAYVRTQVEFGPRNLGGAGHEACKNWIISKLNQFGTEVSEQKFKADLYTGESFPATNIIAKINPGHAHRILLAAHWDSRHIAEKDPDDELKKRPILGADDGASGVGVLLEIARTIQNSPPDLGVDLVFFDAEDHGDNDGQSDTWCLGSQYWARNLHANNRPQYGILLDMVGSKGATFPKEGISVTYANGVVEKVWNLAKSMGYGHYFTDTRINQIVDDHLFVNQLAGLPMIDIINHTGRSFGAYHHTHDDDMDVIDRNTLRAVGQVITALLYKESVGAI
ncbi:MAG: M28 family peptidase [Saprospiraceae bacterium]|nr:M28 family peptidase [Saprospiraceae bacterium]